MAITPSQSVTTRTEIKAGDIGYITYLHGILYKKEYEYNYHFERYVAAGLAEFIAGYDAEKSRLWVLEDNDKIVGGIVMMQRTEHVVQLRYFLLLPEYRGLGLGKKLMQAAIDFAKAAGYRSVYLWTTSELKDAARLYQAFGFVKTQEQSGNAWGKDVIEERYDAAVS